MSERPGTPAEPEGPVLARGELAALAKAVRPVGGRGRGPMVATVLIVAAFVVGLVRPWDWLASGETPPGTTGPVSSSVAGAGPGSSGGAANAGVGTPGSGGPGADDSPTCGHPLGWRSATLQRWAGRPARVWSAVETAPASGPGDPSIPFQVVGGEDFTALGWCAPVAGAERPPAAARGRLFRVEDGAAVELAFVRLEPAANDALGELWVPEAGPDGTRPAWPEGRYVIELRTPSGAYVRYLGLELGLPRVEATPSPDASPGASPTPTAEAARARSRTPPGRA